MPISGMCEINVHTTALIRHSVMANTPIRMLPMDGFAHHSARDNLRVVAGPELGSRIDGLKGDVIVFRVSKVAGIVAKLATGVQFAVPNANSRISTGIAFACVIQPGPGQKH
jgi:hypothetical protein